MSICLSSETLRPSFWSILQYCPSWILLVFVFQYGDIGGGVYCAIEETGQSNWSSNEFCPKKIQSSLHWSKSQRRRKDPAVKRFYLPSLSPPNLFTLFILDYLKFVMIMILKGNLKDTTDPGHIGSRDVWWQIWWWIWWQIWTFFRYTHSLNIWLPHNLPGLVSDYFPFCHSPKSICPLGLLSSGSQCSLSVRMNQCKMLPHKTKIPLRWAVYLKGAQIGGQRIKGRGRNVR